MGDFLKCPRLYFLRNVYKDPGTGRRVTVMNPHLALGQTVHEVVESLSLLKVEERLKDSLIGKFNQEWETVRGELGGFSSVGEEKVFKERGVDMLQRVMDNPGFILNKAVKLFSPDSLPPRYLFSEKEDLILCGKIDWLEYLPENDSLHIIDFKTGKNEEDGNSLQLPIYYLLAKNLQGREIEKASYWYLEKDDRPSQVDLPDPEEAQERVLEAALRVKQARTDKNFKCPKDGCYACEPFEAILEGKAKFVGAPDYQDIYVLK